MQEILTFLILLCILTVLDVTKYITTKRSKDMITAVIFDMDGVIADSEYFNVKAKHIQLQQAGVNVDWHYHDKFLGTTHEFMWSEMKKEFGLKEEVPYYINQWVEVRKKLIEEEGLKPMPGVVDLIRGLKEQGLKLAVASSSLKEDIMENMNLFGITDCFDAFVSGSECENGKPDPEIFLKAAAALGKRSEECVVVEDSTAGVQAAKSAEMFCIGYAPEDAPKQDISKADHVVNKFSNELVGYIMKIEG